MKKRLLSLMLALTMVLSLVACGKTETEEETAFSTVNTDMEAGEYAEFVVNCARVYKGYMTVGQYTGRDVTDVDEDDYTVTDDSVEDYIEQLLEATATSSEVSEGVTKDGDTITLDYSGTLDGEAFSGGTATNVSYVIGSGSFIEDLDQGLIGLTVGQEYQIPCTFPESYSTASLAGQSVIFTVTVNSITVTEVPDFTDDWVVTYAEQAGLSGTTTSEFRDAVRAYLEESAMNSYISARYSSIYSSLEEEMDIDNMTYPDDELQYTIDLIDENIQSEFNTYGSLYGISDLITYVSYFYGCSTTDEYNEWLEENAKEFLFEKMLIFIIAVDNDITVTATEIEDYGAELADYYGYDDYNEILDTYGTEMNCEVGYEVLSEKVIKFISQNNN